jgi:hypothetical protein
MLAEQLGETQSKDTFSTRVLAEARRICARRNAGAVPWRKHRDSPENGDDENAEDREAFLRLLWPRKIVWSCTTSP